MRKKDEDAMKKELADAIDNVQEKKHVLNAEAVHAKKEFDLIKESLVEDDDDDGNAYDRTESSSHIDEINGNIKLLAAIFQKSNFDEYLYTITHPGRLFVINLINGFFRGMGFLIGLILIAFLLYYLVLDALPADYFMGKISDFLINVLGQ